MGSKFFPLKVALIEKQMFPCQLFLLKGYLFYLIDSISRQYRPCSAVQSDPSLLVIYVRRLIFNSKSYHLLMIIVVFNEHLFLLYIY